MVDSIDTQPPGTFSTSAIAPVYVGGMPLDELVKSLAANADVVASQKQTAENSFWSTDRRAATDPTREVFEVSLSTAKKVNAVAFDLPRFPHKAYLFYQNTKTKLWTPALKVGKKPLVVSITDSVPVTILPAAQGTSTHPQHYGAGHWVHYEYDLLPFLTAKFRLVLVRQKTLRVPVNNARKAVPYSLGVRGFNVGYKIKGYNDIPRKKRDPVIVTERESFTSTTDILGSPVAISVRENRATDLLRGAPWKCEPQPIPNAVVNLYVDSRDTDGNPQVIDRFLIDPVTTGVNMNIYYSNEIPDQAHFAASDNPLGFPLVRQSGSSVIANTHGLTFPDAVGYIDIDNAAIQFKPTRPFWVGVVIQPQFTNGETTRHIFLDTGTLRLEWDGSAFLGTFAGVSLIRDDIIFPWNQQLSFVLSYDGEQFHMYTQGEDRSVTLYGPVVPTPLPVRATGPTSMMRLGGLIVADDGDPGHGNFRLQSLILKSEMPPDQTIYDQYFNDFSAFVVEPEFDWENLDTTDNTILRYSSDFQTVGLSTMASGETINPFGFIGGPGNIYEDLTWTPIARDFKLNKGYCVFNPTKARYFKFEFTNLSAQPYDDYTPVTRKVKVFPTAQYYPGIIAPPVKESGNTAGGGTLVSQDAASTLHYADQVRLYTNVQIAQKDGTYTPTQALYSQNPLVQGRLRANSLYFNLQEWHLSKFCPKFVEVRKHVYEQIEIEHNKRLAYFVGIRSLQMIRVDYAVDDDTDHYLESFQDDANFLRDADGNVLSGWLLSDDDPALAGGHITTPDGMTLADTAITESKIFTSRRKVIGLQFATHQTPPVQLLEDSDFRDPTLNAWRAYGDVKRPLALNDEYLSDIGSMVLVERGAESNYWASIEERWASWDDIENSDPDPFKPTWGDLEFAPATIPYGGIESVKFYEVTSIGRLYGAVRVYTTETLSAPLYVQIITPDGQVISEEPFTPMAGQISEWFCSYTVGEGGVVTGRSWDDMEALGTWDDIEALGSWDLIDDVTATLVSNLGVRLVQVESTDDSWYVDNLSLFDDPIVWEFSNDAGLTWWPVYDIRNDPHGAFMFPSSEEPRAGLGLRWRVVGAKSRQRVNYLAIRPLYDTLPLGQPYRETVQALGPNQALIDHYPPITEDPRWKLWHKPIPEDWYFTFRQWLLQEHPEIITTPPYIVVADSIVPVDEGSPPTQSVIDPLVLPASSYEIVNSTELNRTMGWFDAPTGQPMVSVLSDGTYFASVVFYGDWTSYFRCWHLNRDLSVMGTVDIPVDSAHWGAPGVTQWITNYTVALPDNKVFMVMGQRSAPGSPEDDFLVSTCIIDCSGVIPEIGDPLPFTPTPGIVYNTVPAYDWGDTFRLYDAATDRVIIASTVAHGASWIQVFRGSTGAFLCDISDEDGLGSGEQGGFFMDPADSTQFVLVGGYSPLRQAHFTVSLDGSSATYDGITEAGAPNANFWYGGSPYRSGGGGFLWEGQVSSLPDYNNYAISVMNYSLYADPAPLYEEPAALATVREHPLNMNSAGDAVDDGQHLLAFGQQSVDSQGPFHGLLWCVDQLVTPPAIETLVLPYPPIPEGYGNGSGYRYWGFTWNGEPATVDMNQTDGTVVIATSLMINHNYVPDDTEYVDRTLYTFALWTVRRLEQ